MVLTCPFHHERLEDTMAHDAMLAVYTPQSR
jgi:hypothetical protein